MKIDKICLALVLVIAFISLNSYGQMGIGTDSPNSKAMLDIDVSEFSGGANKKGFLPPRMTSSERSVFGNTLDTDHESMLVFDITDHLYYYWDGSAWLALSTSTTSSINCGTISFTDNNSNTSLSEDNPEKISGITNQSNIQGNIDGDNSRLSYTGSGSKVFSVNCSFTIINMGKKENYNFYIYKWNGSQMIKDATMKAEYYGEHGDKDKISLSLTGLIEMSQNEYVELWVENESSNDDIQIENYNLTIISSY